MRPKIYDCFNYFDEYLQVNLRFNILNDVVDYFVLCESIYDHKGNKKGIKFNKNKFPKFKDKIIHLVINEQFPDVTNPWNAQAYQREYIFNGINNAKPDDLIFYSDSDEIAKPSSISNLVLNKKYGIFLQKIFCYKINLLNKTETPWEGPRVCRKKHLKSFNWLRHKIVQSNMKRSFWRKKSIQLIDDGGWHFNYLLKPEQISQKIKSFAHNEFNKEIYFNIDKIIYRINNQIDPFDRSRIYEKLNFTKDNFPQFLIDNKSNFKDWIL